jgi:hypothetical protein
MRRSGCHYSGSMLYDHPKRFIWRIKTRRNTQKRRLAEALHDITNWSEIESWAQCKGRIAELAQSAVDAQTAIDGLSQLLIK